MQPFSTDLNPFNIRFNTIPLWMSLGGLCLEHHTPDIVDFIAGTAGECIMVLPKMLVPRTSDGYKAKVTVKVFEPLIQGTPANTMEYINFTYHGVAGCYCHACFHLGHDTSHCPQPPIEQQDNILQLEYLFLGASEDFTPQEVGECPTTLPNTPEDVDVVVPLTFVDG
ncbi:hypothetical protein FRX31_001989 [Thalictrum thalictroides]|uniref:DUF4283 domain-containing protein n=1 Tax=Thalictrum thalictroides TaxID=46969 RepID=A0A7J6XHV7_THATH|nr:hypothetical protein FRX31_001989 [Thalictrum thalictroides]